MSNMAEYKLNICYWNYTFMVCYLEFVVKWDPVQRNQ